MNDEYKEEADCVPDIGEASFAFLTSFSDLDVQPNELDFLSSDPSQPRTKAATVPVSPKTPTFTSTNLKDRVQRLQAEKKSSCLSPMRKSSMVVSNSPCSLRQASRQYRRSSLGGSNHGSLSGSLHQTSRHSRRSSLGGSNHGSLSESLQQPSRHSRRSSLGGSTHGSLSGSLHQPSRYCRRSSLGGSTKGSLSGSLNQPSRYYRRSSLGGSTQGSLSGSLHKSSREETLEHLRQSIANTNTARRERRQTIRDSLEAVSQSLNEMELPAPDLMRSPCESTMFLKSPMTRRQTLRRASTTGATLASHSHNSTGFALDSVDEGFKKSKKKKKQRRSSLPMTVPLVNDEGTGKNNDTEDNKKPRLSTKSKKKRRLKKNKDKSEKAEKKEKKIQKSASAKTTQRDPKLESKEKPAGEADDDSTENADEFGEDVLEFSKFEFSDACFDVEMEQPNQDSETELTSPTSPSSNEQEPKGGLSYFEEEFSAHLGEEEIVQLKALSSENLNTKKTKLLSSSPKRRKPQGTSSKKEISAEVAGEDLDEWKTQPPNEIPGKEEKKKKGSVSPSKAKRRGLLRKQEPTEVDQEEANKNKRAASTSKERTLRDRFRRKQGSKGAIKDGDAEQQGMQTPSPSNAASKKKYRSSSASSLRDRFRRRQTSQRSFASATDGHQEPAVPPLSPLQRSTTYSYSSESSTSTGWASKMKSRLSSPSSGNDLSPSASHRSFTVSPSRSGRSRVRSSGRRQNMSGLAPPLTPSPQVSRSGVQITPGRKKRRGSLTSHQSLGSQKTFVDDSSFRSRRASIGGGAPQQESFDPFDLAGNKPAKLAAPLRDTPNIKYDESLRDSPNVKLDESLHSTPSVKKSKRGGRRPNSKKKTEDDGWGDLDRSNRTRNQSPGPDLRRRYASPHQPASPVSLRRRNLGGDMKRTDSDGASSSRRTRSLKIRRGGSRRNTESVERTNNGDNVIMSKLINGLSSHNNPKAPF